jgi:hypothetical protein
MKSVTIAPHNKKELDLAFDLLTEFGEGTRPLSWDGKGDIGFVFLMNVTDSAKEATGKVVEKKLTR